MTSHTARRRKREERRKKLGLPRRPNIEHQDSQEKPEEKTDKSKYRSRSKPFADVMFLCQSIRM